MLLKNPYAESVCGWLTNGFVSSDKLSRASHSAIIFRHRIYKLFISVADLKNHLGNLHCSIEIVFLQDPQTPWNMSL